MSKNRTLIAVLCLGALWFGVVGAADASQCRINIRVKNEYAANSNTSIVVFFNNAGDPNVPNSRVRKNTFWNPLCDWGGFGQDVCSCPSVTTLDPGETFTCSTTLEDRCGNATRDFELTYNKEIDGDLTAYGAIKTKSNVTVTDGGTVTFQWPTP